MFKHHSTSLRYSMVVAAVLLLSGLGAAPAIANDTTFSGQAFVVKASVVGLPPVPTLSDTGPLPPEGGNKEASLLSASVPGLLTAELLHASTVGQGNHSRAEASVATLDLTVLGNTIGADFLMARATAMCGPNGSSSVSGSSEIAALKINGTTIVVGTAPNQTVDLPGGGQVIINEQSRNPPSSDSDITVNALHVVIKNLADQSLADVIVSSAHADVTCGRPPCESSKDFVTGGGWIDPRGDGSKANFAVAGGIKNGYWGHLQYIDHGTRMKVKGTGVTGYMIVDSTLRHIEGTCEIDGASGYTYKVDVADKGEPGRNDTFSLALSNGKGASGTLAGGNIQIHSPCQ
jgi:hypothetical protein